jgi:hypothetical protein
MTHAQHLGTFIPASYDSELSLMDHDLAKGDRRSALKRAEKIAKRNPQAGFGALERVKGVALKENDGRKAQKAANAQRDALNRMKNNRR